MSIGFLFDFGDDEMTSANDEKRGREILEHYYNYMVTEYPDKFKASSLEEMLSRYGNKGPFIAEGLGLNQRANEVSMEEAKEAMEKLADAGQGKMPENWMTFHTALKDVAQNQSWWDALKFVTTESAKDVAQEFQNVGQGLITTLRASKFAIPLLLLGGAAVYMFTKSKRLGRL